MNAEKIFITGATGIMGLESLKCILYKSSNPVQVRILARNSKKNQRKLAPFMAMDNVVVEWGDLQNYEDVDRAMGDSGIVLHIGGMVSPQADHFPQLTMNVNIRGAKNIVNAVRARGTKEPKVVYIGSIAETGSRDYPFHWGRVGDPVLVSPYDYYGISKVHAERIIVEGGLKRWVVLRQSGILHSGLLMKGMDPITFHVPLRGVLEWTTLEDSARLMAGVCSPDVPEAFWNNIYHIGSGPEFRLSNYDFERRILKALNCPPPEKLFHPSWFATRNFHGLFFEDSDDLQRFVPFRENISCDEYFERMARQLPFYFSFAKLAPAPVIKAVMKSIANKKGGTLGWLKRTDCEQHIKALFGSRQRQKSIPSWKDYDMDIDYSSVIRLKHGYDEKNSIGGLDIEDMRSAAEFRGGKCLSDRMKKGDMTTPLEWECAFGHKFKASPMLVVRGGHWCPECLPAPWRYDEEAKKNPFLAQVWHAAHSPEEKEVYDAHSKITLP